MLAITLSNKKVLQQTRSNKIQANQDMAEGGGDLQPPRPSRSDKGKAIVLGRRRTRSSYRITHTVVEGYAGVPTSSTPLVSPTPPPSVLPPPVSPRPPRPFAPTPPPPVSLTPPPSVAPTPPPQVEPTPGISTMPTPRYQNRVDQGCTSSACAGAATLEHDNVEPSSDEEIPEVMDDGRIIIFPIGKGFLPSKAASKAITAEIQKKYREPWTSWGQTKGQPRIDFFAAFRDLVAWKVKDEKLVKRNFDIKASHRLSDMLFEARVIHRRQPHWIGDHVWSCLRAHWDAEKFKKISTQNKKNRASEKGGSLHTGGSISQAQHAERLSKKYGRSIMLNELHLHTHIKKGTGEFVDARAKRTQEAFEEKMTEIKCSPNPPADWKEEQRIGLHVWMDVTGGKNKGRLYGDGDLAEFTGSGVDCPDTRGASTCHKRPDDPIINDLKHRLEASEERRRRLENALMEMQRTQQEMMKMLQ